MRLARLTQTPLAAITVRPAAGMNFRLSAGYSFWPERAKKQKSHQLVAYAVQSNISGFKG
jgi:hypothetical protein